MHFGTQTNRTPELGALELQVLKILWAASSATDACAIQMALSRTPISLSTVQATLERLHRKGLLSRAKRGRAYFYAATLSREQLIGTLIRDLAARFAEGELEPVISGFVDLVGDSDPALLDRLEASAAKRKRKEPR